jgi:predicted ATPase/signal transduction histidine kinase
MNMNMNMNTIKKIANYQVQELIYSGNRSLAYRAVRDGDQLPVVIKLLKNEYPSFHELVHFRNQYIIAKNLNLPGVIKPISLLPYKNGYALVIEDFAGISLSEYLQINKTEGEIFFLGHLEEFFDIAIQLTNSLAGLIRQRVIHKDIKPANILINPETKQVKLIDFSISSLLPRETQTLQSPQMLEGTIAYLSPEQTGRMNRAVDYRTDFYSLGVTFYEMLTGRLPFVAEDVMELIHCHLAKQPTPISELEPTIPIVLCQIVSKLMAKNPENRYQSALGLKYDLQKAWNYLQSLGTIDWFEIGERDLSDRFLLPEKIYGREKEIELLLVAFERVSQGRAEMMLVAGFSGIGKTVVVNEVHKPIVQKKGYFIKGKYDQFQRNIPFFALVQAFRDLMNQLLAETQPILEKWQKRILEAVGDNGQILIEVIPELQNIIGPQQAVTELSGNAAQNRFNLLFQKFVQVFTTTERPLVIFLDDLQWADAASLKLLELLMEDKGHLLVLGAYRDHEVYPNHPFMLTVQDILKSGAVLHTITLQPLQEIHINQLVADTLHCNLTLAKPLAELVYQKTHGNPFFATQFLKALYADNLILFYLQAGYWQCDIGKIKALALTDDVLQFMILQLRKLPIHTQNMLKLAACIGSQFELQTLAIVSEQSLENTASDLWRALQDGLIIPTTEIYKFFVRTEVKETTPDAVNPVYRFLHDRVQQAAYALIDQAEKSATHWQIGRLLLKKTTPTELIDKIFEIVNQLNLGKEFIQENRERQHLIQLNLQAARKAKDSTAYEAAMKYFTVARELLPMDIWQTNYALALTIYVESANTEYLNGNFSEAEILGNVVLERAVNLIDRVKVYQLNILIDIAKNQPLVAIERAWAVLAMLGHPVPKEAAEVEIYNANLYAQLKAQVQRVEDLGKLPVMTDRQKLAAMEILMSAIGPVFVAAPPLLPLVIFTMVNLSLKYGNAPQSIPAYGYYGVLLCCHYDEIVTGYKFGQLSVQMLDQFHLPELQTKVVHIFNAHVRYFQEPLVTTVKPLAENMLHGIDTGDLEFGFYSSQISTIYQLYRGEPLDIVNEKQAQYMSLMTKFKLQFHISWLLPWRQMILNLLGASLLPDQLEGEVFQASVLLPVWLADKQMSLVLCTACCQTMLNYLFERYDEAIISGELANEFAGAATGMYFVPIHRFYYCLVLLAAYPQATPEKQTEYLEKINLYDKELANLADHAPSNYQHKYELLQAERQQILGDKLLAMELYDRAIQLAQTNQFIQDEALACELAGKFYLKLGRQKIAQLYMTQAYYAYARWGAKAKVEDLEKRYADLLEMIIDQPDIIMNTYNVETLVYKTLVSSNKTNISDALDLAAITKASQALSEEIQLDQLVSILMHLIMENTGADHCHLLLLKNDILMIEAIARCREPNQPIEYFLNQSILADDSQEIPLNLINYVLRTREIIEPNKAITQTLLASDEYFRKHQPLSFLAMPIIHQSKLIGIIYLENSLTAGTFHPNRLDVMKILTSQAAICLEKAQLYSQLENYAHILEKKVVERTQEISQKATELEATLKKLYATQSQLIQAEKMSGLGQLVAGIAHEINNPINFIYANLNPTRQYIQSILELNNLYQELYPEPLPAIIAKIDEIELDYITEDLDKILDSIESGTQRIMQIVLSLRNFSRHDEAHSKPVDIHTGIDSTLLILQSRLNTNKTNLEIIVKKEYGQLPLIDCYAAALNQVFMNIFINAIDALEEAAHPQPEIRVKTELSQVSQSVIITLADNGPGISPAVQNKIFDPFFTTKTVGQGTGLGLSIAYSIIVEKHGGEIICNSIPGEGTKFIITLPLRRVSDEK